MGLGVIAPVTRLVLAPASEKTVVAGGEPLDVGDPKRFSAEPRRVDVIAPVVKDAWSAARDVVLGAAWIRSGNDGKLEAFSAVCPHLGCAVGWDATAKNYLCPCHDSRFDTAGARLTGPAQRGLDPLPLEIKDGRVMLTWLRFRTGGANREPA